MNLLRRNPRLFLAAAILPWISSCGGGAAPQAGLPDSSQVAVRGVAERVHVYVNTARTENGRRPLARDPRLDKLALRWAGDCAGRSEGLPPQLSHRALQDRLQVANRHTGARSIAENIHCVDAGADPARRVVAAWLASSIHRRNIDGPWTDTGVAAVTDSAGRVWIAQIYASVPD
ncbi:MAG: CAP domain-containing protein [Verrucomicrobiae bacterium]|nr:CAP domain-containing protein [Verrucomicrobiae bacterium]MCP5533369.1 CAP domain-containing protein [Akkermansiaceae bacterium]MCP5543319.1 CAP domain-containing protein [Akkermansiaceae bacterium]